MRSIPKELDDASMPIVVVPSTRTSRILKAVAFLFLWNLLLGGGLGLFVEYELRILPNDPFYGIGAGIVLANLGTYLLVRALYRRAARAATAPYSLGDFLDNMLYVLLGIEAGFPIALQVAVSTWKKQSTGSAIQSGDVLFLAFGVVAFGLAIRATMRLLAFLRKTSGALGEKSVSLT